MSFFSLFDPPKDLNSTYYECLWGVSVNSVTFWCSILGIIIYSIATIATYLKADGQCNQEIYDYLAFLLSSILLLVGNIFGIWWMYVPELIAEISLLIEFFIIKPIIDQHAFVKYIVISYWTISALMIYGFTITIRGAQYCYFNNAAVNGN